MANLPNGQPWEGLNTFATLPKYQGYHIRNFYRAPIEGTHTAALAARLDHEKNLSSFLSIGQRIREVYHSCMQLDGREDQWQFTRVLGCGSFGLACLYQRWQHGSITDEVVAKSEEVNKSLAAHPTVPQISKEVYHMAQLNDRKDEYGFLLHGVVQLRGYRVIQGNMSTQGGGSIPFVTNPASRRVELPLYREWRTFMENCSYGNLARLALTYKAWGYHIPEAFIWWTFFWLIRACKAMEHDERQNFYQMIEGPGMQEFHGSFMLSNDLKHENIFVGGARPTEAPGAPFDAYPAARMGDFGLSRLAAFDEKNRSGVFPAGTHIWNSPEKRYVSMGYDPHGQQNYLFYKPERVDLDSWTRDGGHPQDTFAHCIGPEANIWGAAVAILLLMTLEDIEDINSRVLSLLSLTSNRTRDSENVDQYLFDLEYFATFLCEDEDYSDELKNLVRECTRIEPTKRPDADETLKQIYAGIQREHDRLQEEFGGNDDEIRRATRMAFTNGEWAETPEGPFLMMERSMLGVWGDENQRKNWRNLHAYVEEWADPDAPTLVPPRQWTTYQPGDGPPRAHTAGNQPSDNPFSRPFYGHDWLLYTDPGFMDNYHRGQPLPRGGRAYRDVWQ